jgi:type II secretory ATPase GspE/PulE/Tfp pilus assembly ATPase PilB-like protein
VRITHIHLVQKVTQFLTSVISAGVSDIHFEPFEDAFRVRCCMEDIRGMIMSMTNILEEINDNE